MVEQHAQAEAAAESLRLQLADASAGGADAQSLLRQQLTDADASAQRAQPGGLALGSGSARRAPSLSRARPAWSEPAAVEGWRAGLDRGFAAIRGLSAAPHAMPHRRPAFVHAPRSECQALQAQLAAAFEGRGGRSGRQRVAASCVDGWDGCWLRSFRRTICRKPARGMRTPRGAIPSPRDPFLSLF